MIASRFAGDLELHRPLRFLLHNNPGWERTGESSKAFAIPVYRLWNQRADSIHRYTTRAAIEAEMLAAGYVAEGYRADGVVMCAVQ